MSENNSVISDEAITSEVALNRLPFGTVILDGEGDAWQKFLGGWMVTGGRSEPDTPTLPATVIHNPYRSQS